MRILFTTRPLTGHVEPLRPLAAAASDRGHDVAFATGEPALSELRERGLRCFEAGRGSDTHGEFAERTRQLEAVEPIDRRIAFFTELFIGIELEPRLDGLLGVIDEWRPDVIVHEAAEPAAPIAAAIAGIPYATVGFGALLPDRLLEACAVAAAPHWRSRGLEPPPHAGFYRHLYVDPFPPSLQPPGIARPVTQPARLTPVVETDLSAAPAWITGLAREPTVYITLGTVWNRDLSLFDAALAAVDGLAVNVVVTLGANGDPAALGEQPANVHVHRFVPQRLVLPFCDVMVCHGGSGTMLGGVAHGLPQLVLPQGADQFANADLLAATGAGRALLRGDCTPAAIRHAVGELLEHDAVHVAARRLRDELDAMPGPAVAIERVEELARA